MAQSTEFANSRHRGLDTWSDAEVLAALWESQADGLAAVRQALPSIAAAVRGAGDRLRDDGRIVYVGAGSSGRIAFQDGVELGPTFGWTDERLVLLLAGGDAAIRDAVEGAEDDTEAAAADISKHRVGAADVLIGVAASGGTRYTVAAVQRARAAGALTIGVANARGPLLDAAELAILAETGGEVIAGSTRLKAGTAQKVVLNLFSTLLMTRLGHVYDGRMIDLRLSNDKLRQRAAEMVSDLASCDMPQAIAALERSGDNVKLAILLARGQPPEAAAALLARHRGHLRAALTEIAP